MNEKYHAETRKKLFKNYDSNEVGIWEILGEDPNPDWGGHHHQPKLDLVEGKYSDIVEYALGLPSFFTWGGGGRIVKLDKPKKIDETNNKRIYLEAKKKKLLKELETINEAIKNL